MESQGRMPTRGSRTTLSSISHLEAKATVSLTHGRGGRCEA